MKKVIWIKQMEDYLRENFAKSFTTDICKHLGLTEKPVTRKAHSLGLKKDKEWYSEYMKEVSKSNTAFRARSFAKGHVPHNKGVPMAKEVREKVERTMFKKGSIPPNSKYDGAISLRGRNSPNPYFYIRLEKSKWVLLHRYIYEKAYGKIPEKHIIIFKDGDFSNCTLANLEMIHRKEGLRRNSPYNEDYLRLVRLKIDIDSHLKQIVKEWQNQQSRI